MFANMLEGAKKGEYEKADDFKNKKRSKRYGREGKVNPLNRGGSYLFMLDLDAKAPRNSGRRYGR